MNLKEFLKLAGQQGKVVFMDEGGNVKGVFLPIEEYQKISGGKASAQKQEDIIEKVNREILQAQLEDVIAVADGGTGDRSEPIDFISPPERIDSLLSKRAQELFKFIPYVSPHKDFKTPEVATSSDEEIKPNFDDI